MTDAVQETSNQTVYSGARATAVKILNRIERSDSYLDKLLDVELKAADISNADKGLLAELVHGVIRWQARLDWLLNRFTHGNFSKSEINIKNALRIALYQILFLDRVPQYAVVNEAVEFIKRIRGGKMADLVNAVLRNILRNMDNIRYPTIEEDVLQHLTIFYSHPVWMVKRWLTRFSPAELEKMLAANNEIPSLSLRINKIKINPAAFLLMLDEQTIPYQGSTYIDYFIRVKSLSRITQMETFRMGYFSIQDESAALPVLLLSPQPGDRVIDLCAAPGGKTTLLGEMMKNEGEILAIDKYEHKLNMVRTSCERLGITNVQHVVGDSTDIDIPPAKKVIVDAPCSGLGVLRKKPDIKWKRQLEDITQLASQQERLMENAARLVEPGGVLVYSTCTIEPEENELLVQSFLTRHPEFKIDDPSKFVNKSIITPEGYIATFPHRHQLDGSFAVRLTKSSPG
ncbi:MAG: 16S rRNA (cytosine(967)-C(5))-methyltransferase RsmB [Bacteroidota bacterium]